MVCAYEAHEADGKTCNCSDTAQAEEDYRKCGCVVECEEHEGYFNIYKNPTYCDHCVEYCKVVK